MGCNWADTGLSALSVRELLRYEKCPDTRAAQVRELPRYEKCPDTRAAQVRELLRYENCPGTYEKCPDTRAAYVREWPKVWPKVAESGRKWRTCGLLLATARQIRKRLHSIRCCPHVSRFGPANFALVTVTTADTVTNRCKLRVNLRASHKSW